MKATIDVIAKAPTGEFDLILYWEDFSRAGLLSLQTRLNQYLEFALDGELVRQFPDAIGRPVRIVLDYAGQLTDADRDVLSKFQERVRAFGVTMVVESVNLS